MNDLTNAAGILSYPYKKKKVLDPYVTPQLKKKKQLKTPGRSNIKNKAFNFQKTI